MPAIVRAPQPQPPPKPPKHPKSTHDLVRAAQDVARNAQVAVAQQAWRAGKLSKVGGLQAFSAPAALDSPHPPYARLASRAICHHAAPWPRNRTAVCCVSQHLAVHGVHAHRGHGHGDRASAGSCSEVGEREGAQQAFASRCWLRVRQASTPQLGRKCCRLPAAHSRKQGHLGSPIQALCPAHHQVPSPPDASSNLALLQTVATVSS